MNRRGLRILGAGSAAVVITLLCYLSGIGGETRFNLEQQVSNLSSGVGKYATGSTSTSTTTTELVDTYDKTSPPGTGCEPVVADLQRRVIEAYGPLFEGIRHINMFGYLG